MALICFFVSDLHGRIERYRKLFKQIITERPDALFIGGDLLPSPYAAMRRGEPFHEDFIRTFLTKELQEIKEKLGDAYPRIFTILGNDDARTEEPAMIKAEKLELWTYCHYRRISWGEFTVYGYTFVPPTPFRLKDWERFDVTDYTRPGCISPLDIHAVFTVRVDDHELRTVTIEQDLKKITADHNLGKSIFLFHSPPHRSSLDRAALDGHRINDIQVDVHVGSTAIRRFIEKRQPLLTLHGHIHESTRMTGSWQEKFARTHSFNASHDGPELALVRFDPYCPQKAVRELI
jgi:Icc-related predicted phosphoesterase